jgi:hypothetical protein
VNAAERAVFDVLSTATRRAIRFLREGRYDDAVRALQVGLAVADHIERDDLLDRQARR